MVFLITLISVILFAIVFKIPLKKAPWLFYIVGVVLVVLFVFQKPLGLPINIQHALFYLMHKCTVAQALFTVVMFVGVFSEKSRIRAYLMPIRAELSILGCIFALGHIINYTVEYLPHVLVMGVNMRMTILLSLFLALLLIVLLLVLGITSFNFIKRKMRTGSWKRVQWFAYIFYTLIYIHLMLLLLPSALLGGDTALFSVVVYTVVFVSYAVLRIRLAIKNRSLASATTTA